MNSIMEIFNNLDKIYDNYYDKNIINNNEICWVPSINIIEKNSSFIFTIDLPGIEKKDINIDINNDLLTISGERKINVLKNSDDWHCNELKYGKFSRTFNLPDSVNENKINANYNNGVLILDIGKIKPIKPKIKKIEIS